jgi:carboxyl-terminal processing protease
MLPDPNPLTPSPGAHSADANPAPFALPSGPAPTGLIDQPVPVPVVASGPASRRSWPFAVSMVLVAVMGGGALFMSGFSVGREQAGAPGTPGEEMQAWRPFWDVYDAIRNRYPLGPIDSETLIEGAIRGMVDSVGDPYTSYLSPEDFRSTLINISGAFEGIGAEIGTVDGMGNTTDCSEFGPNCRLVIIAPFEGSPAEKAGLKPGDIVASVDGSTLDGLTPDQARDRIRGAANTSVRLHIVRLEATAAASPGVSLAPAGSAAPGATGGTSSSAPGASAPAPTPGATPKVLAEFDVTLVRAKIQRREVITKPLAGGTVAYIRLTGFSDAGAADFKTAVKDAADRGVKKIVVDLRGNPGGFLPDAREVASEFIGSGPVFWQEDAQGVQTQTDAKPGGGATDPSIQVVVLIDRGTASASEIVAGALQDRGRARLIGETSYGKGTVQEWLDLAETGGVKLTVSKWLTPNKRWIHKIGLTPDVPVTVPADSPPGVDPVLDRALQELGASALGPPAWLRAA